MPPPAVRPPAPPAPAGSRRGTRWLARGARRMSTPPDMATSTFFFSLIVIAPNKTCKMWKGYHRSTGLLLSIDSTGRKESPLRPECHWSSCLMRYASAGSAPASSTSARWKPPWYSMVGSWSTADVHAAGHGYQHLFLFAHSDRSE